MAARAAFEELIYGGRKVPYFHDMAHFNISVFQFRDALDLDQKETSLRQDIKLLEGTFLSLDEGKGRSSEV